MIDGVKLIYVGLTMINQLSGFQFNWFQMLIRFARNRESAKAPLSRTRCKAHIAFSLAFLDFINLRINSPYISVAVILLLFSYTLYAIKSTIFTANIIIHIELHICLDITWSIILIFLLIFVSLCCKICLWISAPAARILNLVNTLQICWGRFIICLTQPINSFFIFDSISTLIRAIQPWLVSLIATQPISDPILVAHPLRIYSINFFLRHLVISSACRNLASWQLLISRMTLLVAHVLGAIRERLVVVLGLDGSIVRSCGCGLVIIIFVRHLSYVQIK